MSRAAASDTRVRNRTDAAHHHASPQANLLALLASGAEISGSAIAARLGITRAAVWKQIEQLRAHGLKIEAEAGHGYRIGAPLELLDRARIFAAIRDAQRTRVGDIDVFWQVDSTSSELARRAGAAISPQACLAEIQTQGRGRRGRAWQMPLGGGIALSYLRRFDAGMATLAGLSLVVGVAVLRALADCGAAGAALKWPNDIVADGRKLGGILVELGGDALGPCHAVIGIGINVRVDPASAASIDQPWTDLMTLSANRTVSRNELAGSVLSRLAEALEMFASSGFVAFESEYAENDALRGQEISVEQGGKTLIGIANGITSRGALRFLHDGVEAQVESGEVSIRRTGSMPFVRSSAGNA